MLTTTSPCDTWQEALLHLQPDRVAWIREEALDPELVDMHRERLRASDAGEITEIQIAGGEALKEWQNLSALFDLFTASGLTRHSLVLTHGGGALSDAVAFAASVWKRGMQVMHFPTTTLACVDAAWGGKTAMNWGGVKNQVGSFHPPLYVHIDSRWLRTLPEREFRAGLAEAAKHAMLEACPTFHDAPSWKQLVDGAEDVVEPWNRWLADSAQVKMNIVRQDPKEQGLRALLNLGHTVGHAVESASFHTSNPLLHGEAVAVGLAFALHEARLAVLDATSLSPEAMKEAVYFRHWLTQNVPLRGIRLPQASELWMLMAQDKKNVRAEIRDLAWRGVGNVLWPVTWKKEPFEATWNDFLRCWNEPHPSH